MICAPTEKQTASVKLVGTDIIRPNRFLHSKSGFGRAVMARKDSNAQRILFSADGYAQRKEQIKAAAGE